MIFQLSKYASWILQIVQDSDARKIAIKSGRDVQRKEGSYGLQQHATKGLVPTHIMQVEEADAVEMNMKPVPKDDDDHKKLEGKYVEEGDDIEGKDEHKKIIEKDMHASKPTHMDHNHMDPELNVFFTPSDLNVGKTMPIYFAKKDSSTSPKFLPREEADQIPFSSKQFPLLLKFFSFSKHSVQAKAMKYTLEQCEFEAMEGETKFCATSLESLLDFARDVFGGSDAQFKVLTTTHLTNTTVLLQNYTISEVREISVPNVIGCHPMPFPYAVFYCHSQKSDTNLYEVLVEGQDGGLIQAAAICHMDTSKWDPDHVSFRVLNVEPGTSPVCHFFPPDNLAWVPLPGAP